MNKLAPLVLLALLPMLGCYNSAFKGTYLEDSAIDLAPAGTAEEATAFYEAGEFENAFAVASPIVYDRYRDDRYEAAYIAGLSAQALGNLSVAEDMLTRAMRSDDASLVTDAADALGLVYSQQGRYELAQDKLMWAGARLTGERQARAYYYAGIAQQKLGYMAIARNNLLLARGLTQDPVFREQVSSQINVTGWTLQLGAFTDRERARAQAQTVAQRAENLSMGPPRLVDGTTAEGNAVTYVYVGQFLSYQSAIQSRNALAQPGVIIRALRP